MLPMLALFVGLAILTLGISIYARRRVERKRTELLGVELALIAAGQQMSEESFRRHVAACRANSIDQEKRANSVRYVRFTRPAVVGYSLLGATVLVITAIGLGFIGSGPPLP